MKLRKGNTLKAEESVDYLTGSWKKEMPIVKDKASLDKDPKVGLFCPEAAIVYKNGKFSHIDYSYCKGCGICSHYLPKAIIMKKV